MNGQKKDLKELSKLMSSGQYNVAFDFMKELKSDKKESNFLNLYLAEIYKDKSLHHDFIKDSDGYFTYTDSSIFFYEKFKSEYTNEYFDEYQGYYDLIFRNELRRSNLDHVASNSLLELVDNYIDALQGKRDQVSALYEIKNESEQEYASLLKDIQDIISTFSDYNELILLSDSSVIERLSGINDRYNENVNKRINANNLVIALGQSKYSDPSVDVQTLNFDEIKRLKKLSLFEKGGKYLDCSYFVDHVSEELSKVLFSKKVLYNAFREGEHSVKLILQAQKNLDQFGDNGLIYSLLKYYNEDKKINNQFRSLKSNSVNSGGLSTVSELQTYYEHVENNLSVLTEVEERNNDFEKSVHLIFIYKKYYGRTGLNKWMKETKGNLDSELKDIQNQIKSNYRNSLFVISDTDSFPVFSSNRFANKHVINSLKLENDKILSLGVFIKDSLELFVVLGDSLMSQYDFNTKTLSELGEEKIDSQLIEVKTFVKNGTSYLYYLEIISEEGKSEFFKLIYNTDPLLEPLELILVEEKEVNDIVKESNGGNPEFRVRNK
ncbi:hypothetical protein HH304_16705 [Flammeovirgaceae bacterium KN852]|uniref:Uncharacterized protein n=1 Tax=Marinigracilibium pacificum TaxID=2729599 RepID=A0A848J6A5_9BACT|nr:hypothetical protein [Marinigracilibium pacificum]